MTNYLDQDDTTLPDVWCGTEEDMGILDFATLVAGTDKKRFIIGPYTTEEWRWMDQTFRFDNTGYELSDQDAACTLTVRVRGLGETP